MGYFIDTENHFISIPEERLLKVFKTINLIEYNLENISEVPARLTASLVGQLVSMSYVIGNVTNMMTKYLSIDILDKQSWNSAICLSKESLDQIAFWKRNLRTANLKEFTFDLSCHIIVYSDASNTGYGGYMVENPSDIAHGMWSSNASMKSSTWKELTTVKNILFSINKFLHNKRIKQFTDNQNVVSIINKGSMKRELQDIAINILRNCLNNNISIDVEWIPRSKNDQADCISRIVDYGD